MKRLPVILVAAALGVSLVAGAAGARTTAVAANTAREGTIVQTAVAAGQFTRLVKLVTRAGLASTLEQPGPFTVFAPTDAAFKKVPTKTLATLFRSKAKLRALLLYHVVPGEVTAADVVKLTSAKTLNGENVRIRVSGRNVFVGGAKVTKPDVPASNGVIHVVNRVLVPR